MQRLLVLASLAASLAACGGARVSGSLSINDELTDPRALGACATGDAKANLEIISDLRDSYHEMIVCGGLQLDFEASLVNVIANAALGGKASAMQYRGDGVFATPNGMMLLKTTLADGRPLSANPLDPQSYLVGIRIGMQASSGIDAALSGGSPWKVVSKAAASLDIQFTARGPLFDILDLGSNAAMSTRLLLEPKKLAKAIAKNIYITNRISVDNDQGGTTIHYILEGSPQPLADNLDHKQVPMKLVSIVAEHKATGQTIRTTEWTMAFKGDGGKVLDGTIGVEVDGGAFPYAARFTYPHRMEPDIDLTCR
jgi:hypothetical protein